MKKLKVDPAFLEHLVGEDDLGAVIRTHIHIEADLNRFIEDRVAKPKELPRLQYESRLRLACALGFERSFFEPLKLMGDLRNAFGHRLDAKLTKEKINEIFSKMPQPVQKYLVEKWREHPTPEKRDYPQLSAKDQFVAVAVILKAMLHSQLESKAHGT